MSETSEGPSNELRGRVEESRKKLWLSLEANRDVVSLVFFLVVFFSLLVFDYLLDFSITKIILEDSVDTLFQALLTVTITMVTLVLTINQLVLSQELGAVGKQRKRMKRALKFREEVSESIKSITSPTRPSQFLKALVQVSGKTAEELKKTVSLSNKKARKEIESFSGNLTENAKKVSEELNNSEFGDFDVISSALNFNYSSKIFNAIRLKKKYKQELNEDALDIFERLIELLKLFGPAREHFKTLYFQWELINLSKKILVSSIPALIVSIGMIIYFNASNFSLVIFDFNVLIPFILFMAMIAILPFFVLLSYVIRIATVTKHTLSIGPFILRKTEDIEEVEWNRDFDN